MFFFNTKLTGIYLFIEVRAFIVVVLKIIFYHLTLQYTQYQLFYFLSLLLK